MQTRVALFALACLVAAIAPLLSAPLVLPADGKFPGWPTHYEGRPLVPLPLSALEQRFAENFPGRVGRFSDGQRELVLRFLTSETRKLHSAADCFQGLGYTLTQRRIEVGSHGIHWGSFVATRGDESLLVRERIHDTKGNNWTDVSAWYWAALRDQTVQPWWAMTIAVTVPVQ